MRKSGLMVSSESIKLIKSPVAFLRPRLRAAEGPRFFCVKIWMRGSCFLKDWAISNELSVEPSSMRMISRFW